MPVPENYEIKYDHIIFRYKLKLRTSKIAVHLENSIVNSTKVIESSSL